MGSLSERMALSNCARRVRSVYGQRAALRLGKLHADLAKNPHLSEGVWLELWGSRPPVEVAAALVQHCPSPEAVAAVVRREQRKSVLRELVCHAVLSVEQARTVMGRRGFDEDVALAWLRNGQVPVELAREVAVAGGRLGVLCWGERFAPSDEELVELLVSVVPVQYVPDRFHPSPPHLGSLLEQRQGLPVLLVDSGVPALVAWAMQSRHVFDADLMHRALDVSVEHARSVRLWSGAIAVCRELVMNPNTPLPVLERVAGLYGKWGPSVHREFAAALARRYLWPFGVTVAWEQVVDAGERALLESFAGQRPVRGAAAGVLPRSSVPVRLVPEVVDAVPPGGWSGLSALGALTGSAGLSALSEVEPCLDADGQAAWDAFLLLIDVGGAQCTLGELVSAARAL